MKRIILLSLFLGSFFSYSQTPKDYASKVIEKLTSKDFAGRGYTNDGMSKAANMIAEEFKKIGLEKIGNSYYQKLTYPINIIETSEVSVNGKKLELGKDYLVSSGSPTLKKEFDNLEILNTSFVDSLFLTGSVEQLKNELTRINNKPVIFPIPAFPEHYITNNGNANEIYYSMAQSIVEGDLEGINTPFAIQLYKDKLNHGLSSQQNKVSNIILKNEVVEAKNIKNVKVDIKSKLNPAFEANNIIGKIKGTRSDSTIVVTAHYDHLGQIGDIYFPGANDNASGVAYLLSMAKYYTTQKPKFDIIFICFAGEEAGLAGSRYFVEKPLIDLKKIKFLFNFDIVGYGEEGIQVVNGKVFEKEFHKLDGINYSKGYLKNVGSRTSVCNSDHCPFYEKGVPSFFIYTLGGTDYHDINDKKSSLSLYSFNNMLKLFTEFIEKL